MGASLRSRFTLTFAGLILFSGAVLSAFIGTRAADATEKQIGTALAHTASQMADLLDRTMWARSQEVQILSGLEPLRRHSDMREARQLLERLRQAIPLYSWVGITDKDGLVLESTGGVLKGQSIAARPVFAKGREGLFIGDVHDAVLLSKLLPNPSGEAMKFVDVSAALYDDAGALTGVLATHLSWEWAREVENSILGVYRESQGMDLFIIAADGTVLLGDRNMLGKRLELPLLSRVSPGADAWAMETWPDGRRYLTGASLGDGYRDYNGLGWIVLARQPEEVAYASVRRLMRDIVLAGVALSLLFAAGGWLVAGHVVRPLAAITQAAQRLRRGEDALIPRHHGIAEIEVLSSSLSELVESLTKSEVARERMRRLATRDPLTGLNNRLGLAEHLSTALPRLAREGGSLRIFCLDLDGFKKVNDTLGHPAGDLLLKEVAARLQGCLRGGDMPVRVGGDEFLVLSEEAKGETLDVAALGRRIIAEVGRPYDLDGVPAAIGVSIGAARWPEHGERFEEAQAKADAALYEAKRAGKNTLRSAS